MDGAGGGGGAGAAALAAVDVVVLDGLNASSVRCGNVKCQIKEGGRAVAPMTLMVAVVVVVVGVVGRNLHPSLVGHESLDTLTCTHYTSFSHLSRDYTSLRR